MWAHLLSYSRTSCFLNQLTQQCYIKTERHKPHLPLLWTHVFEICFALLYFFCSLAEFANNSCILCFCTFDLMVAMSFNLHCLYGWNTLLQVVFSFAGPDYWSTALQISQDIKPTKHSLCNPVLLTMVDQAFV